jgi:hypothetical protein
MGAESTAALDNIRERIVGEYALAKDPKALILDNLIHEKIRAKLLRHLTDAQFLELKDHWLSFLLKEDSEFRKQALRRIIAVVSPKTLRGLLREYLDQSIYYYDIVYWMDRLCFAPKAWSKLFLASLDRELRSS